MNERIAYLDALKGGAIVLMVMGHVLAWSFPEPNIIAQYDITQPVNVKVGGAICQLIYSFHMALFFMISGFLLYKEKLPSFNSFLSKKVNRLLLPWIFSFGIAYMVRGSMGFWFLLSLFEISIIGYLLILFLNIIKSKHLIVDLMVIAILYLFIRKIANINIYGIEIGLFAGYWLPFCVGVLMRKHNSFFTFCCMNNTFYTIWILLFVVLFSCRYFTEAGPVFSFIYKHSKLVLPMLGSFIFWHLFSSIKTEKIINSFSFLGQKTLPIYILHIIFVIQIISIGQYFLECNAVTSLTLQLSYSLIVSIIAIIWSLLLYRLLRSSKIISLFLFGEQFS